MDQISLPMRIALAACLVFAALWFVALRPKPVEEVPIPTVAEATPQADTAKAAADKAPAKGDAAKSAQASEPKAAAKPKTKAAAEPAVSGADAVVADLEAGRTVVLLFSAANVQGDDRAVRRAVAGVDRRGGKVRVHRATMGALPKYEPVIKNVPVTTAPTVLVIDGQRQATPITGLTTTREIDKLVAAALKD